MSFSKYTTFFVLIFLAISSEAIPIDDGAEDTTLSPPSVMDNVEVDEVSPEEEELDKEMTELKEKECFVLLGDCWIMYKERKPYLSEDTRLQFCLKSIKGFLICETFDDSQAINARVEAEERTKVDEEKEAELKHIAAERKEKLEKRKAQLALLRLEMRELAEEQRIDKENPKTSTSPDNVADDESIERIENEIEAETATIGTGTG